MRASASAPARHLRFRSILGWYQISNQLLRSASAIAIRGRSWAAVESVSASFLESNAFMPVPVTGGTNPIRQLVLTNGKTPVFANERGRRSSRRAGRHDRSACPYCFFIGIEPPLELGIFAPPVELGMFMPPPEPCIIMLPPAAAPPGAGAPI